MGRLDELLSAQFTRWEERGRGYAVWPEPVEPEPPFVEFSGYQAPPLEDDTLKPGLFTPLLKFLAPKPPAPPPPLPEEEPEPRPGTDPLDQEFIARLTSKLPVSDEAFRAFLASAGAAPMAFEMLGHDQTVSVRWATSSTQAPMLARQLRAYLPGVTFQPETNSLAEAWHSTEGDGFIIELGLARPFLLPLRTGHSFDPFVEIVSALSGLPSGEVGVFQVLFQPVRHPWESSAWRAVTDREGKMLFVNSVPLIPGTKEKLSAPLYAVVLRLAAKALSFDRSAELIQNLALALRGYGRPDNNHFLPLTNNDYSYAGHEEDLLNRQSRRSGMLLNQEELLGLVHLPGEEVVSPALQRSKAATKPPPAQFTGTTGLLLGVNEHLGRTVNVVLPPKQRFNHTHVVGATGTGKSTLLLNMIEGDIHSGQGVAVFDPHGDLIHDLLGRIPQDRIQDVILFNPSDTEFPIGFNILSARSEDEKQVLASDLVAVFRRLCTSWGDQMGSVLRNAITAFLESERGGTLAEMRLFLLDESFRREFLASVRDPDIAFYWRKVFPKLGGNRSIGPVLTRLDTFLASKPIRHIVSQRENRLDFESILDSGKIFLAKLSQEHIASEDALLLGSLLMAKFQQTALARQRLEASARRDFFIYLDEFQNFITPSVAECLTGTRKYAVGLILAHQDLHQLQRNPEVAHAVLGNSGTRVVFRVGDADAPVLEKGFSFFTAQDLQSLDTGQAVVRVERRDYDFNLRVPPQRPVSPELAQQVREQVVTASREKYATAKAEVAAALFRSTEEPEPAKKPSAPKPVRSEPRVEEIKTASAPAPEPVVEKKPEVPRPKEVPADLGMGGAQHQATQKRIKQVAEGLGFLATIEKPIPNGSIDVLLERGPQIIACEISVTTSVDHEFGNVAKCLEAGLPQVAVISRPEQLRKIAEAVTTGLGAEAASRVLYQTPDEFVEYLGTLPRPEIPPPPPHESVSRGRKLTVTYKKVSPQERQAKEAERIGLLAEVMRGKAYLNGK